MDSKKDNGDESKGNSNTSHPQLYPPYGMMGAISEPEMMEMVAGGLENAINLTMHQGLPAMLAMGPPPPPGFLGMMSPPVIHHPWGESGYSMNAVPVGGTKKAKKHEKDSQQAASRTSKRSRTDGTSNGCHKNDKEKSQDDESDATMDLMTDSWKNNVLAKFSRCQSAEGIRETSYFVVNSAGQNAVAAASASAGRRHGYRGPGASAAVGSMSNISCLRKLLAELNRMEYEDEEQLPGGPAPIWLRYDDECPQYMRSIITGPHGTPYSNGLFVFDIYVPDSYPSVSPKVQLLTTGGGTVRFGPNLYQDGKVCLSLLGTWSGPKWDPGQSSLLQILVSIQGLIFGVVHPYYMEPGYGGWEGSHSNNAAALHGGAPDTAASGVSPTVKRYDDNIRLGTMKVAIAEHIRNLNKSKSSALSKNYLSAFEDIVRAHFWHRKDCILADAKKWQSTAYSPSSQNLILSALKSIETAFGQMEEPLMETTATAAPSAAKGDHDNAKKPAAADDRGAVNPETAAKRLEMEAAAASGDYITAGRIQSQLQLSSKVDDMIVSNTMEMDDAATRKDYVEAGRLQLIVKHLESNRRRLQHLEKRMFEYASKQDFKKASQFQEQIRILMEDAGADKPGANSVAAKPPKAGGHWQPPMPIQGGAPIAFAYPKVSYGMGGGYYGDGFDGEYPEDHADY